MPVLLARSYYTPCKWPEPARFGVKGVSYGAGLRQITACHDNAYPEHTMLLKTSSSTNAASWKTGSTKAARGASGKRQHSLTGASIGNPRSPAPGNAIASSWASPRSARQHSSRACYSFTSSASTSPPEPPSMRCVQA